LGKSLEIQRSALTQTKLFKTAQKYSKLHVSP